MKAKIRIALAIDPNGTWNASGWSDETDECKMGNAVDCIGQNEARYWIECEVDIPEVKTIQGVVNNENTQ